MAKFHFFTDLGLLSSQTSAQAFGPTTAAGGKDRYRTTSLHTATSNPKAYAICDGIVFIQEQTGNSSLVNLILKPLSQPPFAFPKIKFFIYHGIQKSSLISGSDIAARGGNNTLTESLWKSQDARNLSEGVTGINPPMQALGIDISGNGSIDDIFYRTDVAYQLPIARSGWDIGTFSSAGFGLDILVEAIGFDPDLTIGRSVENLIEVTTLASSPTQPQMFEHWHDKEAILNYIDPCAFWGSFYHFKLKVIGTDNKKGDEIYDQVLTTYLNKNKIYLDIRNEYNHSFNYFKNYGTTIKAAFDNSSPPTNLNYYRDGWPILILKASDFSTTTNKETIRLQMPDGNGDNTLPLMYVSVGRLSTTYPRESKGKNKFIELEVDTGFTGEISLTNPAKSGSVTPISTYIKLKYNKRFDPENIQPSSGTVIRAQNYLDNIFAPFDMKVPFPYEEGNVTSFVYNEESYIDALDSLFFDFIAKLGIAKDTNSFTLFAIPTIRRISNKSIVKNILSLSGESIPTDDNFINILIKKGVASLAKATLELTPTIEFPEAAQTYLKINIEETILEDFKYPDITEITALTFSTSDYENLIDLKTTTSFITKYRIYLGVSNKEEGTDDSGNNYTRAILVLRGFENNGVNIQVKEVMSDIKIYSDGNI